MHKLLLIVFAIAWVVTCSIPWIAMEPNVWRIPAAIGLAPLALPIALFGWFGSYSNVKLVLRASLPKFVLRAWDNT